MADSLETGTMSSSELLGAGRRHLAVRDFHAATEALAKACEVLAKEHGDTADQCAESYLWYGKALLGLSREESGVLARGAAENSDDEEDQNEDQENNADSNDSDKKEDVETEKKADTEMEKSEDESPKKEETSTKESEPSTSAEKPKEGEDDGEEPGTSNGEANDESMADIGNEDDIDNLQLAWETLDLSRSILSRRVEAGGGDSARALLADVYLTLGEVALESETYDKAVLDMQSCLEIQKKLYRSDDRLIAETHYQIGLANSLASNFEEAITHFKNAANILETRIKSLESPTASAEDATVKEFRKQNPFYSVEGEIKELKELLPEIQEKIQDMMDYKAETIKRVREALCPSNGNGDSPQTNGAGTSTERKQASDISHLIKRKRKSSEGDGEGSAPKRMNT